MRIDGIGGHEQVRVTEVNAQMDQAWVVHGTAPAVEDQLAAEGISGGANVPLAPETPRRLDHADHRATPFAPKVTDLRSDEKGFVAPKEEAPTSKVIHLDTLDLAKLDKENIALSEIAKRALKLLASTPVLEKPVAIEVPEAEPTEPELIGQKGKKHAADELESVDA